MRLRCKISQSCGHVLICILGFFLVSPRIASQPAATARPLAVQVLFVSDIHLEPFRDPAKAAQLASSPVSDWNKILSAPASPDADEQWAKLRRECPTRGEDSTNTLFASSLRAIHAQASGASFAIVSGDLIAHSFSCKYEALFPKAPPAEYRAFVEKTIAYVLAELRAAVPGTPVYAALGNNDSDCGDYRLDAGGSFLKDTSALFAADIPGAGNAPAIDSFAALGDLSVSLPAPIAHTRLLVLDDIFQAAHYETCAGKTDRAPAAAQVAWLKQQLDAARANKEKIWVMAHIPPGVNAYSTLAKGKDFCGKGSVQMFLASEALPEALAGYGDVIQLAIFAHTHADEMRLLTVAKNGAAQEPVAAKLIGSISPINGNLPSITLGTVDPATATLTDYRVIVSSNSTGIDATWAEEYDFAKTYRQPAFTAASVEKLVAGLAADPVAQTSASRNYIRNYATGFGSLALSLFWQPYACSLANDSVDAYKQCVCKAAP